MWQVVFWWLLKVIGPWVIEKIIDWIWGEITGTVSGDVPSEVRSEPRAARAIRRILSNEAKREQRYRAMKDEIARAKKKGYARL
jgi:hypothetical protein